jgi:hypothetical protein
VREAPGVLDGPLELHQVWVLVSHKRLSTHISAQCC